MALSTVESQVLPKTAKHLSMNGLACPALVIPAHCWRLAMRL